MKKITLLACLFAQACFSQTFLINSVEPSTGFNELYEINMQDCSKTPLDICAPDTSLNSFYFDVALDGTGNVYLGGGLHLYRQNLVTNSCEYLGQSGWDINALVADASNYVYAAGSQNVFKYNVVAGTFEFMGTLPYTYESAGDMFFYENRLFLTARNTDNSDTVLIEINMTNISQSCVVASIPYAYGAFAIDYGDYSKAYIVDFISYENSYIKELDMETYTLSNELCHFSNPSEFGFLGAATAYSKTSTNSTCTDTAGRNEVTSYYINIANPSTVDINLQTNIDASNFTAVQLYDVSGRLVKQFKPGNITNLDVSDIASGSYILQFSVTGLGNINKNIIIK